MQRNTFKWVDSRFPRSCAVGSSSIEQQRQGIRDAERVISDIKSLSHDSLDVEDGPIKAVKQKIDAENLNEQINDAKKLGDYIEEYKIDANRLLENAAHHYEMMYEGAYDEVAAHLIKARRRGGDEDLDMAKLEERYELALDQNAPNLEQRASSSYGKAAAESNAKMDHDIGGVQNAQEPVTEMSQRAHSIKR